MNPVPYWHTVLGDEEGDQIRWALKNGQVSQGKVTEEFERAVARVLDIPYVIATTSGTAALYLAAVGTGIGPGDEVVLPNRTFVATAHAVMMAGGRVTLVDTHSDRPLVDENKIENVLTPRTKALLPVHLNGASCNMEFISDLAKGRGLKVIEDAAQAFYSRNRFGFLGTQGDVGCYSLGITKFITTGQGGLVVTRNKNIYERILRAKNHGVFDTFAADFQQFGFNLKFTDIQAAIGLVQLKKLDKKKAAHLDFYHRYQVGLKGLDSFELLSVNEAEGNVPLWAELLCADQAWTTEALARDNIQVRPFLPDLDLSGHLGQFPRENFPNSRKFSKHGICLPSGPDLPGEAVDRTVSALRKISLLKLPSVVA